MTDVEVSVGDMMYWPCGVEAHFRAIVRCAEHMADLVRRGVSNAALLCATVRLAAKTPAAERQKIGDAAGVSPSSRRPVNGSP